jgi:uncharacterized surface protein with fasciclin (FAS1) repeats
MSVLVLPALLALGCSQEPEPRSADDATATEAPAPASGDIVETASSAGSFTTLVAAVQAAGLEETLKSPGPFTVFAPTDDAFAKLPEGTVESLLKPENKEKLAAILTYHVVSGKVMSTEAVKLNSATTVNGKELSLDASTGKLVVSGATVTTADVQASNGVIHVVDTVLLPQ